MKTTTFKVALGLAISGLCLAEEDCYGPLVDTSRLPSIPDYEPFSYEIGSDDQCENSVSSFLFFTADGLPTMTSNPDAVCLDGSSGSFYLEEVDNARGTVILLDNDGLCVTEEECLSRSKAGSGLCEDRGTSNGLGIFGTENAQGHVILSSERSVNPLYYNYNKVIINDCDGGAFMSSRGAVVVDGETIYMNGAAIVQTVFHQLNEMEALDGKIVLASNGYASIALTSWIQDWVSSTFEVDTDSLVYSGLYFDYSGDYSSRMNPYAHEIFEGTNEEFWSSAVSTHDMVTNCDSGDYRCILTANTLAQTEHRTMIMGSSFDPWQLSSALGFAYHLDDDGQEIWNSELQDALEQAISNRNVFGAYTHCQITNDVFVKKMEAEETCGDNFPWANFKYEAAEFPVETEVQVSQGDITFQSAMTLFHHKFWPTSSPLFQDKGGFGSSLCF